MTVVFRTVAPTFWDCVLNSGRHRMNALLARVPVASQRCSVSRYSAARRLLTLNPLARTISMKPLSTSARIARAAVSLEHPRNRAKVRVGGASEPLFAPSLDSSELDEGGDGFAR